MSGQLTPKAERALVLAQEEARNFGWHYIKVIHVLLGLLHDGKEIPARCFSLFGVDVDRLRIAVGRGAAQRGEPVQGPIPLSEKSRHVLDNASRMSRLLRHDTGPDKILQHILDTNDKDVANALQYVGIDKERLRIEVARLQNEQLEQDQQSSSQTGVQVIIDGEPVPMSIMFENMLRQTAAHAADRPMQLSDWTQALNDS